MAYLEVILHPGVVDILDTVHDWTACQGDNIQICEWVRSDLPHFHFDVEFKVPGVLDV
jgi:hypothetical protein